MNWLDRIFRRRRLYSDVAEEVRQHIEEKAEQLMSEGMGREEAELAARRAFGNVALLEERGREVWQWTRLENLWRDIGYSARLLKKSPGFTAVAILTLTLGIGANTAIFSLLNGLLLRPLPVPNADRLAVLRLPGGVFKWSFCAPLVRALEPRHEVFRNTFAFSNRSFQVREKDGNQSVPGSYVSGQYFAALETPPERGRVLTAADDSKDSQSTTYPAVISDAFWTRHFNRAVNIIGRKLVINGVPFTVVGVMPKGFFGFDSTRRPDIWVPLIIEPRLDAPYDMLDGGASMWWLQMGARLQPGVSLARANAWLSSAMPAIAKAAIPNPRFRFFKMTRNDVTVTAEPGSAGYSFLRTTYRNPLLLVFVFCVVLLLLSCINLASLLLARATMRQREIATRLAIGATRRRLVQQLLVDSMLVAFLGSAAGLLFAPLASRALTAMLLGGRSTLYLNAAIDWRVCVFVAGIATLSTVLVGLLPALQATAVDLNKHMKEGAQAAHTGGRRVLPKFLLAVEVALAMVLVSGAGLLSASLYRLYHSGFGFDPDNLLLVNVDLTRQSVEGDALLRLYEQINDRFASLPYVQSSGYATVPPLSGSSYTGSMHAPGGGDRDVNYDTISPGYFHTLGIRLIAGRGFTQRDASAESNLILINQRAARMFFPTTDAVGKTLTDSGSTGKSAGNEIVGVVGNTKYQHVQDVDPPMVYYVIAPDPKNKKPYYTYVLCFSGPVAQLATAIRHVVAELAPDAPAPTLETMDQQIDDGIAAQRVMALLSVFFAVCALLVTGIGLYGVLAWSTARRKSEIGVRMALGAQRAQVVGLVFRENLWSSAAGCAGGLAAAVIASRAIASFLYCTSPRSPWILSAALALLCVVAAAASLIPALRAASIDPMQALRSE